MIGSIFKYCYEVSNQSALIRDISIGIGYRLSLRICLSFFNLFILALKRIPMLRPYSIRQTTIPGTIYAHIFMAIHGDSRAYSQYGELRFSNKVIHTNQFKLNRTRSKGHPPSTVPLSSSRPGTLRCPMIC